MIPEMDRMFLQFVCVEFVIRMYIITFSEVSSVKLSARCLPTAFRRCASGTGVYTFRLNTGLRVVAGSKIRELPSCKRKGISCHRITYQD